MRARSLALVAAAFLAAASASAAGYNGCADVGNGKPSGRAGGDPGLNLVKNREFPASTALYTNVPFADKSLDQPGVSGAPCGALPKPLPGRRDKWTGGALGTFLTCVDGEETKLINIEGYMLEVKRMMPESVNCNPAKTDHGMMDFHMWLVSGPAQAKNKSIIVEVTPRIRNAKGWTEKSLTDLEGKYVKIWGRKLFDQWHRSVKHRRSAWEIHPVLYIEVWNDKKKVYEAL